jgi:GxxExxY protein
MNDGLKYKNITEKIIGALFEVHKFLGNGFQEVIYQRALAWELSKAGLTYAQEIAQEIFYKELQEPIGTTRADFVVEGKVLMEVKSINPVKSVIQTIYDIIKAPGGEMKVETLSAAAEKADAPFIIQLSTN